MLQQDQFLAGFYLLFKFLIHIDYHSLLFHFVLIFGKKNAE